ncbi:GntR family transcriptional regulator [Brucella intermedia]|uniref:GntR family transcriptional regulator n=1 Tax=Brucella intermedia TaxID=94625 RepID=UPI00124F7555|nr:GntR family transcriptional regulator [Brucella intermedia]KAB2721502.1 GntR family transcriptional regulator [Brucella intermedia]
MSNRYESETLRSFPQGARSTGQLSGVEAEMYLSLWRSVFQGKLRPGIKLREDTIGETFGVSRTLVRKVLIVLEQEGIVSLPANHGAFVATPTPKDAWDVIEALRMTSIHIITRLGASDFTIDKANHQRIQQHIELQKKAEAAQDFLLARELAREFFILLVFIYGNQLLTSQFVNLMARMSIAITVYSHAGQILPSRVSFQERIYANICEHNVNELEKMIDQYFTSIVKSLNFEQGEDNIDLKAILLEATDKAPDHKGGTRRPRTKATKD